MPDEIRTYKCPSCGAPLAWHAGSASLGCANCGNSFSLEAVQAANAAEEHNTGFDWGDYKQDYSSNGHLDDTAVYQCKNCGAEIEADATTAATTCPYCGNNVVLTDRVSAGLRPNGVIPFSFEAKDLGKTVREYYKKMKLLPRNFFSDNELGKVQGLYVPFWLFDATVDGPVTLEGTQTRYYREGDYDCTETSHFLLERAGSMRFENVPVDGSTKADDDLMDSVEPYDFSGLKPFDPAYLSGFLADRFDQDPDASLPRANTRMEQSVAAAFAATAGGFSNVRIRSNGAKVRNASVRYVLLPVYLFSCTYGGKEYRYAVNGQTGKVVGEVPVSKLKKRLWFWIPFAAIFLIVLLLMLF